MLYLAIVLAGGIGALTRFLIGRLCAVWVEPQHLPIATLSVNLIGSFLIGYLSIQLAAKWQLSLSLQWIIISGLLGGFTTFSAFSLELVTMLEHGNIGRALFYSMFSVTFGVALCYLGVIVARAA